MAVSIMPNAGNSIDTYTLSFAGSTNGTFTYDVGKKITYMPLGKIYSLTYQGAYVIINSYSGSTFNATIYGADMTCTLQIPYLY